jgi:hypothetical protein
MPHNQQHLNPDKFEVLFHLLTGYYLVLCTLFEKFNYYFDFEETLSTYNEKISNEVLENWKTQIEKKKRVAEITKIRKIIEATNRIDKAVIFFKWESEERVFDKYLKKISTAKKNIKSREKIITFHTVSDEAKKKQSEFFLFFKFFYAITGLYCINILILNGFIEEWHRFQNLRILVSIQFLITIYFIVRVLLKQIREKFLGIQNLWSVVIFFGILYLVTISIPSPILHSPEIKEKDLFHGINYNDILILTSVALGFVPIILHNITLYRIQKGCMKILEINDAMVNLNIHKRMNPGLSKAKDTRK